MSHDKNLQTNIKNEKEDHHVENYLKTSINSTDNIDQPLLIVLDEDDGNTDDENEQYNSITNQINLKDNLANNEKKTTINSKKNSPTVEQSLNSSDPLLKSVSNSLAGCKTTPRPRKSRLFPSLNERNHQTSNKFIRTVVIDTSFMRQTHSHQQHNRNKLIARRKNLNSTVNMSNNNNTNTNSNPKTLSLDDNSIVLPSTDSILSKISFDNTYDILTVSRMGSVFYCLEDLYTKVFSTLCTLDEFTNILSKSEVILIKQVTLSEKISIEQQIPLLKKYNENRYRLVSINSSDYLLKLKQLLLTIEKLDENEKQHREKSLDQIIDEMRSYKRTPTLVLLKDKVSHSPPMNAKRLSSDDDDEDDDDEDDNQHHSHERLKIVTKKQKSSNEKTAPLAPTQFGIFIQCNGPVSCNIFSTNETVSSTTTTTTSNAETTTTTTTVAKTEAELISKATIIKKQNEKFQQQQQNSAKFNETTNEQPMSYKRTDSQSPNDPSNVNKLCPSSTVMNMPMKRRILNSYNSDTSDSSGPITVNSSLKSLNPTRCLYRSKSLILTSSTVTKNHLRRSTSLPSIRFYFKESFSNKKFLSKEQNFKSKTEPVDLNDGSYSMPMIVNVEENVEFNNQRQKNKNPKARLPQVPPPPPPPPLPVLSRSTSHESDSSSSSITKPIHIDHPTPPSSYRSSSSSYHSYHQDSYAYRDSSQMLSYSSSSASHMINPNTHGNHYPYPYPQSSSQYPIIKKSKDLALSNSIPSTHPSSSSLSFNHNLPSSVIMPIVRKPNSYHHPMTSEQQQQQQQQQPHIKMSTTSPPVSTPCRLPCCYPPSTIQHQQQQQQKSLVDERTIYRQYTNMPPSTPVQTFKRDPSQTPDIQTSSSSPSINRKQRRLDSIPTPTTTSLPVSTTPYPHYPQPTKSYFVPPPPPSTSTPNWPSPSPTPTNSTLKPMIRYPYPPAIGTHMNGLTTPSRKIDAYPQPRRPTPVPARVPQAAPSPLTAPVVVQNHPSTLISPPNTPHELTLPNIRTRSIDLQRALIEHGYCDMDKLPKLVVRHTKTYTNRTIDTMGQLFPTWFSEPDYRCIHCFRCDQVFTPQQFMTHVDDDFSQNEQPISMTSIQLLTSEKMSEYKVGLWNQFCTNLTIYAREGRIGGFSTNRNV